MTTAVCRIFGSFDRRTGSSFSGVFGFISIVSIALLLTCITPAAASASTYRWQVVNGDWNNPANWTVVEGPAGAGYPNLPEDVALFDDTIGTPLTATIPNAVSVTIGRLLVDDNVSVFISPGKTGELIFDNGGADAGIGLFGATYIQAQITLNANLSVTRTGVVGTIGLGTIGEAGGSRSVSFTGVFATYYADPKTYTGATNMIEGVLTANSTLGGFQIPGPLNVGDGVGGLESAQVSRRQQSREPRRRRDRPLGRPSYLAVTQCQRRRR